MAVQTDKLHRPDRLWVVARAMVGFRTTLVEHDDGVSDSAFGGVWSCPLQPGKGTF